RRRRDQLTSTTSKVGTSLTWLDKPRMSASLIGRLGSSAFQVIRRFSVDIARGHALLYGLGTKALPAWGSKTRWNNLSVDLAVGLTGRFKQTYELTSSIVPRGTSFHHAVELEFPPLVRDCFHAAAACRVQRNSVPSTQMRCMITARRRARATIARFMRAAWRSASPKL